MFFQSTGVEVVSVLNISTVIHLYSVHYPDRVGRVDSGLGLSVWGGGCACVYALVCNEFISRQLLFY